MAVPGGPTPWSLPGESKLSLSGRSGWPLDHERRWRRLRADSSGVHTVWVGCCLARGISHEAKCRLGLLSTGGSELLPCALAIFAQGGRYLLSRRKYSVAMSHPRANWISSPASLWPLGLDKGTSQGAVSAPSFRDILHRCCSPRRSVGKGACLWRQALLDRKSMCEAVGHPLSAPPHHHTLSLSEFALISPHWSGLRGIFPFLQGVR